MADERQFVPSGDPLGRHRVIEPAGALPQPAWRLDNDFHRIFSGEMLLSVQTLNIDAASFRQMAEAAGGDAGVGRMVRTTVAERGKQHNPVTGSGGMLLGEVKQRAPDRPGEAAEPGARVATLVSLSLTPLFLSKIDSVREESAQLDVTGEAVIFAS